MNLDEQKPATVGVLASEKSGATRISDLDAWIGNRSDLTPARSVQPLRCAHSGYGQPIEIHACAGEKRSLRRVMPLRRRALRVR